MKLPQALNRGRQFPKRKVHGSPEQLAGWQPSLHQQRGPERSAGLEDKGPMIKCIQVPRAREEHLRR